MSSPSLRPLIDTCQKCSTSPANHEPRSPANGSFQNPGVCPQAVPSFPSPTPTVLFLALAPFSAQAKYRKPRSSIFLCSQTLRKRLLRRLVTGSPSRDIGLRWPAWAQALKGVASFFLRLRLSSSSSLNTLVSWVRLDSTTFKVSGILIRFNHLSVPSFTSSDTFNK